MGNVSLIGGEKDNCLGTFRQFFAETVLVIFHDEMFIHFRGVFELGVRLHLLLCNIKDCVSSLLLRNGRERVKFQQNTKAANANLQFL